MRFDMKMRRRRGTGSQKPEAVARDARGQRPFLPEAGQDRRGGGDDGNNRPSEEGVTGWGRKDGNGLIQRIKIIKATTNTGIDRLTFRTGVCGKG